MAEETGAWKRLPIEQLKRAAVRVHMSLIRRGKSEEEALARARLKHVGLDSRGSIAWLIK